MFRLTQSDNSGLTQEEIVAVVSLVNRVWPHPEKTVDELVRGFTGAYERYFAPYVLSRPPIRFMAWKEDCLAGHAFTFERPMHIGGVETPVMALAQVCVDPACRGNGLGARLARCALQRLQSDEFPLSIFQTTVPGFYEKLGARIVENQFINSRNPNDPGARPWKDGVIMIYPQDFMWPHGSIDLNGPGY